VENYGGSMNITSDELYQAIKDFYQALKDSPDDFLSMDEALEDVEVSSNELLKMYQGHIMAQRMNKETN
jgi:hypothetical protein